MWVLQPNCSNLVLNQLFLNFSVAPPPKAGIPRRSVPTQNNKTSQDLFGSTPFDLQPSAFDVSRFLFYFKKNVNTTKKWK